MKYASLFTGIGGFDLGFDRAGMECVLQVEQDVDCLEVLGRHWPNVKRVNDVRKVKRITTDLVCGGFPCQDVSVAGKRAGLAGERSGLWFEFHRIVERNRPRWVVIENVPGLLSSCGCPTCGAVRRLLRIHAYLRRKRQIDKSCAVCHAAGRLLASHRGRDFAIILRGLVECGYGVAWRVLDAQYFGLAQRRKRVFVVASLRSGRAAEVLFEREGGAGDTPPGREAGARVAGTLASGTLEHRHTGSNPIEGLMVYDDGVAETLNSGGNDGGFRTEPGAHLVFDWQSGGDVRLGVSETHTSSLQASQTPAVAGPFAFDLAQITSKENRTRVEPFSPASTLNQAGQMHAAIPIAFTERTRKEGRTFEAQEDIAYALTNPGSGGRTHSRQIAGAFGVRRLMPIECERLQGFPDGHTDGQTDSIRYRQLGNAIAVPCAEWIGRRIAMLEAEIGDA